MTPEEFEARVHKQRTMFSYMVTTTSPSWNRPAVVFIDAYSPSEAHSIILNRAKYVLGFAISEVRQLGRSGLPYRTP